MAESTLNLEQRLAQKGISRRGFLKFCAVMTATLALPERYAPAMAEALNAAPRRPVVWLEFQDCTGDTESFLRSGNPTITQILLETISLNYHETLMVGAGRQSEKALQDTLTQYRGQYIAVIEGAIPGGNNGTYCMVGGKPALQTARTVCAGAAAVIAAGTCAFDGGWRAAVPNPTGAMGVKDAVPGIGSKLINMPGCPVNAANLSAAIVYYLTQKKLPETDSLRRPKFAYDEDVHDECPRKDYYEDGKFVLAWGDQGHRNGWCLYKMGCKGPQAHNNCSKVKWNSGTNWCVGAGHGCVACAEPRFWDTMTPFYRPGAGGGED